ncbi:AMP-binding protein, partial [Actinoplanes utahensis]
PALPFAALIEAQVARTPDAVAVECDGESLTYAQLDARANQVARLLAGRGAGPGRVVALTLPRSIAWVVTMLGVLKSGAAYCPVDATLPRERIDFMLADAGVTLVVDDPGIVDEAASLPDGDLGVVPAPTELAYVIYTSGSTGKPKGVGVTHTG